MGAQALQSTSERLARCHNFLLRAGWPLGMMPMHGLYKAIIARAQVEIKAKSAIPPEWPQLVADAAKCAGILEEPASETAKLGVVVATVLAKMIASTSENKPVESHGYTNKEVSDHT